MAVTPVAQRVGVAAVPNLDPLADAITGVFERRRERQALEQADELAQTAAGVTPEGGEAPSQSDQDAALARLALRDPQTAGLIQRVRQTRDTAMAARMKEQMQRHNNTLAAIAKEEDPQRRRGLIGMAAQQAVARGEDGRMYLDLLNEPDPDQQLLAIQGALLGTEEGVAALEGVAPTAAQREFETLTEGLPEADITRARRIELGLDPRAVGNTELTIADRPDAEDVTTRVGDVAGGIEGAVVGAREAQQQARETFQAIDNIRSSIAGYDDVIRALDAGAETGAIMSRLPSVRANAIALDNARNRLGLAVVGAATFGALSEGELNLALSTALPDNMEPEALRQWVTERRDAQTKLADEMVKAAQFLGTPGNTIADYLEMKEAAGEFVPARESGGPEAGEQIGRFRVRVND